MLIPDIDMLKPQILTGMLRAVEILGEKEEVIQVKRVSKSETTVAKHYILALQYKDFRTQRHAPDRIFVKIGGKNTPDEFARKEVDFYTKIVPVLKRRLDKSLLRFPACYDAYYDDTLKQYHIILDDVSQKFKAEQELAPPTARHREQVMDTLAHFHAVWWEHPLLEDLAPLPTSTSIEQMIEKYQRKYEELNTAVGKYIDSRYREILKKVSEKYPQKRRDRLEAGQGITLVHHDLHPKNILYSPMETMIVNWQSWRVDTATDDLAYMIGCFWPQHLRKFQEQALLKRYYQTLVNYGVSDYSWEDFQYDYKASLVRVIGFLLAAWTRKKHTSGYWAVMETAMSVFDELECVTLLE
jgi:thiamine kinase-like enzyme